MGKQIVLMIVAISVCCLTSCANTGIVKLSPDTYMLSREDHGGIFGNASRMKAGVIREANEFAEKQGKIAIPLSINEKPIGDGPAQWASVEYQFRVVDKKDHEARRTHLTKSPDMVIKRDDSLKADINISTKEESEKSSDLYTELIKLDDLQKRGILTIEEFEIQKKRLLENQK
ncbi:MAG: SHOCT domain-containing protein [Candidatus Omnitrophica bacterium]|nr:SHOCT domain-containing protein [Candidatus Omnitrophota bacterium]